MNTNRDIVTALQRASIDYSGFEVVDQLVSKVTPPESPYSAIFECFSLGDLLKTSLILKVLEALSPNINIHLRVTQEYFDYEEIRDLVVANYDGIMTPIPPSGARRVAFMDTLVDSYSPHALKFDDVFPTALLAPIHGVGASLRRQVARAILGITEEEKVLVVSNFSSLDLRALDLGHIEDRAMREDFVTTHLARQIPVSTLASIVNHAAKHGGFDRVVLVPRNIEEERVSIQQLQGQGVSLVKLDSGHFDSSCSSYIIGGKGVLRSVYAMADAALVAGYHNILEPYLCNESCIIRCVQPPARAPNRFLFDAGKRLGILRCLENLPSNSQDVRCLLDSLGQRNRQPSHSSYYRDELCLRSIDEAAGNLNRILSELPAC